MTTARHTSDNPDWYTPSPYVEAAREVMGGIDLDPLSDAIANQTVKATRFFGEADNGLLHKWSGRVFVNPPPGGLVVEAWRKLLDEPYEQAIWIGYSLEQLQTLQVGRALAPTPFDYPMCIPMRRIAFVENDAKRALRLARIDEENALRVEEGQKPKRRNEKSVSPSHANYICYLGAVNVDTFVRVFSQFGQVRL